MLLNKNTWFRRRQINKAAEISPSVRARLSIQSQRMDSTDCLSRKFSVLHGIRIRKSAINEPKVTGTG
jgi:hypothetical protein